MLRGVREGVRVHRDRGQRADRLAGEDHPDRVAAAALPAAVFSSGTRDGLRAAGGPAGAEGPVHRGFLARLAYEKHVLGRPVHRIVQALAADGLDVAAGTLCGALKQVAPLIAPWAEAIAAHGRTAGHVHADETSWQVFEDIEDKDGHRWWLWVFVTDATTVFVMDTSRSAEVAAGQLGIDREQTALEAGRGWSSPRTSTRPTSRWPASTGSTRSGAGPIIPRAGLCRRLQRKRSRRPTGRPPTAR